MGQCWTRGSNAIHDNGSGYCMNKLAMDSLFMSIGQHNPERTVESVDKDSGFGHHLELTPTENKETQVGKHVDIPEFKPLNAFEVETGEKALRRPMQFLFRQSGRLLKLAVETGQAESIQFNEEGNAVNPIHNVVNCGSLIGVPYVPRVDLVYEEDDKESAWLCGKFTTFIPMRWKSRKCQVTIRELRKYQCETSAVAPDVTYCELEMLSKIHHPNVLMLMGIGSSSENKNVTLVYERVNFGSLYTVLHIQAKRLSKRFVIDIITHCCKALDFLHNSGFIHCGLSSHAVFLVSGGCAKIGCLEYCSSIDENDKANTKKSKWLADEAHLTMLRHWMAPETLADHTFTVKADVYSMCSIIWELCYGLIPRDDLLLDDLLQKIKQQALKRLPLEQEVILSSWRSFLLQGLSIQEAERALELSEIIAIMKSTPKEKLITAKAYDGKSSLTVSLPSTSNMRNSSTTTSGISIGKGFERTHSSSGDHPSITFSTFTTEI